VKAAKAERLAALIFGVFPPQMGKAANAANYISEERFSRPTI
jgi:hypothetical protein